MTYSVFSVASVNAAEIHSAIDWWVEDMANASRIRFLLLSSVTPCLRGVLLVLNQNDQKTQ
jgi:hypothetical protein